MTYALSFFNLLTIKNKTVKVENKPIKVIKFKNGFTHISVKGHGIMENNPNKLIYLNHVKDSIEKVEYIKK